MASSGGSAKPKKLTLSPNAAVEDTLDNEFGQGAIAGPSSPSRRRRRPSASRRRSSSITAAASLISSYSTSPPTAHAPAASPIEYDTLKGRRGSQQQSSSRHTSHVKQPPGDANEPCEEDDTPQEFGDDALETAREATQAFRKGKSSPYHMALVSLLFSLAQGMPLASQFKVYAYMMCQLYKARYAGSKMVRESFVQAKQIALGSSSLPPAPELPASRVCENIWVDNATSTYAAAMAMVGALLSLILLNRCSRLSDYFGRKPLLLGTHVLLALSTTVFRLSIFLPTYVGVGVLYVAVMILEASAGAPLKIAIQNYVMDTTTETQRAGALSFTDGFGQLGAFPSSTLGGWLAVVTQKFFAPFYASIAVYALSTVYVLLFVPESKKKRHHTLIDGFERVGSSNNANPWRQNSVRTQHQHGDNDDTTDDDADTDGGVARTESYFSSVYDSNDSEPYWKKLVHRFNFLAPLAVFIPDCKTASATQQSHGRKWRLSILALIVILEESYQVFMIPVILLYNTSVFHYDVVQNGYLVSLLQGVRALYLTLFFPWAVSKARTWTKRRKNRSSSSASGAEPDERTPLQQSVLRSEQQQDETDDDQREERGRLDVIIMLASYLISAASFVLMAMTRRWYERKSKQKSGLPSWVEVAIAIVGLQIGAGATSLRTALLVNAVSEQADEQELLAHQEAVQQRRETIQQYGSAPSPRITRHFSALSSSAQSNTDGGGGASSFHVHHERHQSKALAANQILCTAVYAIVPLVTSRIFGAGIAMHKPELVWIFKAAMALLAALTSLALLFSYKRK